MGLFSFIGKAVKGVAHIVGGALKFGGALGIIPGGGLLGQAASLLNAKKPMGSVPTKINVLGRVPYAVSILRAKAPTPYVAPRGNATAGGWYPGAQVLQRSPVLPGGAIATPSGPMAAPGGAPPMTYGGARAVKRKARAGKKRKTTSKRRKSSGRKLKFGSPAWRKKYMKKRR